MAQLTIYLDDKILKKIGASARQEKTSVSSWVKRKLTSVLDSEWPAGYFNVFGSLKDDDTFEVPAEIPWDRDCRRAEL